MDLYGYYQKLYSLTKKQRECIEKDNYDQLLKVLEQKQELINEIDDMEPGEYLKEQDNPEEVLTQLQELMQNIKDLEDKNEKKLREKKDKLSEKMKDFNTKQKGREGYKSEKNYEAKFIDKKS